MMAHVNAVIRIGIGTVGLLAAYYQLFSNSEDVEGALDVMLITTVGLVGLLSFAGHFIFHKSDALRLQREAENHLYQYEVGFAHFSFALIAFIVYNGPWGLEPKVILVLAYALFIFQIAALYAWRCHSEHHMLSRYFLRHALFTLVYVGLMIYFIFEVLRRAELSLF